MVLIKLYQKLLSYGQLHHWDTALLHTVRLILLSFQTLYSFYLYDYGLFPYVWWSDSGISLAQISVRSP